MTPGAPNAKILVVDDEPDLEALITQKEKLKQDSEYLLNIIYQRRTSSRPAGARSRSSAGR